MAIDYEGAASLMVIGCILLMWGMHRFAPPWMRRWTDTPAWDYVALLRPLYHVNFMFVLMGVIYLEQPLTSSVLADLGYFYISFNLLLYGGIYTFNAWMDHEQDAVHPRKRHRPIASGRIPPHIALLLSGVAVVAGLLTAALWFGLMVLSGFLAILAVNALYSMWARRLPYLDVAFGGLTYPLRTWLGAQLVGVNLPALAFLAVYALGVLLASGRRLGELRLLNWQNHGGYSRTALERLGLGALSVTVLLAVAAAPTELYLHARVISFGALFIYVARPITLASSVWMPAVVVAVHLVTVPYAIKHGRDFFVGDSIALCMVTCLIAAFARRPASTVFERTFTS